VEKPLLTIASPETSLAGRLLEWGVTPAHSPDAIETIGAWLRLLAEETLPPTTPVSASWRKEHGSEGMTRHLADFLRQCCTEAARGSRSSRAPAADRGHAIP
jgi:DNA-binding transcriptional LysR family regulator